jgi:hypothetical protein
MSSSDFKLAAIVKAIGAYDATEWEIFTREWMVGLGQEYDDVKRFGGSGDMGRDVVGFKDNSKFEGEWHNIQCKHYSGTIPPGKGVIDIGKIIYYSYLGEFKPPTKSEFVAPKGPSTGLMKLLDNPTKLRAHVLKNWDEVCSKKITETVEAIPLEGKFKEYVEKFDFKIFGWKSLDQLLDKHRKTGYWAQRFGGILPPAPPGVVPGTLAPKEDRYVRHILDAYGERLQKSLTDHSELEDHAPLQADFNLHRERFFDAEAFTHEYRDQTETGTVEKFTKEIYHSVQPVMMMSHQDGVERLSDVMIRAGAITPASILAPQASAGVKQGVCHQLANEDKLYWKTK